MPIAIEQVWTLASRDMRLLTRSRRRLLCASAAALAGGIVCGWMTRTTSLPPVYCLITFLVLGGIALASERPDRASEAVRGIAGPAVSAAAWSIYALAVLIAEAAILTALASLIGGFDVPRSILAGSVLLSLTVSVGIHLLIGGE